MHSNAKYLAQQIFERYLQTKIDNTLLAKGSVIDIDFEMRFGVYKKTELAFIEKELKEGCQRLSNVVLEFDTGSKLIIPILANITFLKFSPVRLKNKYLYTIKCEEPSEFNKNLRQELLKLIKK